jgi:DNA-binding cell septation regulator SpoVG
MSTHSIQITEITFFPIRNRQAGAPLHAFARIVLNDAFVVAGLRLVQGKFGMFVAFPREKGTQHFICFPIRKDLQEEMSRIILDEYRTTLSRSSQDSEVQVR